MVVASSEQPFPTRIHRILGELSMSEVLNLCKLDASDVKVGKKSLLAIIDNPFSFFV